MKKVGIITAHCSCNPGASLQAHALCKQVSELGHEPIIIDYRPDNFIDIMERVKNGSASNRERLKSMILFHRLNGRYRRFQNFEAEYYPQKTKCYRSEDQINADPPLLDAYICGSDQIWNPGHVNYNKTYFLQFAKNTSAKRLSYAASIGQDVVDEKGKAFLESGLSFLDSISVREDTAKALLQDVIGTKIEIKQHIDPTMLFPASYWRSIEKAPEKKLPADYILYYPLQDNPIVDALISQVKKNTGLPCVALSSSLKQPSFVDCQIAEYGPEEFLYLIDKTSIVLTNSFHGIAMSLLLETNVIPYRNLVRNSRIESLFRTLHLENFQVDSLDAYQDTDWTSVWSASKEIEPILERERIRATEYLAEALS